MNEVDDAQRIPRELRAAAASQDSESLAQVIADPSVRNHLQEAGEVVLSLLEANPTAGAVAARTLAAALADREWAGDAELAELLLEVAEGRSSERRRVRADLDGVADLLEGSLEMGFGGLLDCATGGAWPESVLDDWDDDDAPDPDADPDRFLFIPNIGSRDAWEDMREFASGVDDEQVREQLLDAIDGRGAFSRFSRVLAHHDDLRARWYAYSAESRCGRARDWLAGEGYAALPPRPG